MCLGHGEDLTTTLIVILPPTFNFRENNLQEKITLLKGRIEDIDLPVKEVDIIISEWMKPNNFFGQPKF
jgi:hypothetical protein